MRVKILVVLGLLLSAFIAPAKAEPPVYWQGHCGGVITWSVQGGRTKIVKQNIIVLDAVMTNYTFVRVPVSAQADIKITMNAGYNPDLWGVTYLFWQGDSDILNAEVEVFINKNRYLISSVLLHELFHATGLPHIETRPSLMNAVGTLTPRGAIRIYPADWQMLRAQNGLCK
jgi:hypothetical protein